MDYSVIWHEKALEDLKKINKDISRKIIDRVKKHLSIEPMSSGKQLKGKFKGMYRYRYRDYRIIYIIDSLKRMIKILQVEHRKNIYKSRGKSRRKLS